MSLPRPTRLLALASALMLAACASTPYQPANLSGNIAMPVDALKTAHSVLVRQRLMDVSGSGGAAAVLSEQFLNNPKNNPVVYTMTYDRQAIHAGGHYEVNTQVFANGELRWRASQILIGNDGSLPATADVTLEPVAP
jgi:uncharacterized lipoprotein YbaY